MDRTELISLSDHVLEKVEDWKYKATVSATINPTGFLVIMGVTLPQYLAKMNDLEEVCKKIKERAVAP